MGEVLPQGNPPKSLRGQPRTPVRLRAHEKQDCWNQRPRHRHREEKGDDVGSEVRVKMIEKQVKAMVALSEMAVPFLSVIGRFWGQKIVGCGDSFLSQLSVCFVVPQVNKTYKGACKTWHLSENAAAIAT